MEDGLAYPIRGDWIGRIVIGGILGLLAVFVIPAVLVVGYLVRVLEETIDGDEVPPEFTDWGGLLSTGAVGTLITLAYTVLPVVVYAVVVGVVSGTGGALGGDVGALVGVVGLLSFFFKARIPPFTAGVKPTTPPRSTVGYKPNTPRLQIFIRIGYIEISTAK